MTSEITKASKVRSARIRARAKQYKLLFIQMGAAFDALRPELISELNCTTMTALDFCNSDLTTIEAGGLLLLTDVETFANSTVRKVPTLGTLRQKVVQQLELSDVCLMSRSPRIAFPIVPGSSLIEDAKVHRVPLLEPDELPFGPTAVGSMLPAVAFDHLDCSEVFQASLSELGLSALAALDHAIFESMSGKNFGEYLQNSELEAIRCAGFLVLEGEDSVFTVPQRFSEFREAVAEALASTIKPQDDLGAVINGLWVIERMIRKALREEALTQDKGRWRKNLANSELLAKALGRANGDTYLTARNVSELRDPIEWLTLGELLEVVRSKKFGGLGIPNYVWDRFNNELVPVRNRISHMRLLKKGDTATVNLWVSQLKRLF